VTTPDTQNTDGTAAAGRNPGAEKTFAAVEIAAPMVTAALMPFLDPQAAGTLATFLAAPALVAGANFTGLISASVLDQVPGGDILRAHRMPFLVSAITTATAAATGALHGPVGLDALAAGWMAMPSVNGVVSVAWWSAVGLTAYSLRKVIGRRRGAAPAATVQQAADPQPTPIDDILQRWHTYISGDRGAHPGQHLHLTGNGPQAWAGIIEAEPGRPVTVTAGTVSGVYRIPAEQIHIARGPHDSSKTITVHLVAPTVDQPQYHALQALWLDRVARSGGAMPGTHLEGIVADPATGGLAAWVVADDQTDAIYAPELYRLAGALATTPLLVSVEPSANPRRAKFRIMDRSPLEDGKPLPGADTLLTNGNGFVQLGTGISGRPARVQLFDPKGGARHALVAGVTGSGKGGVLQLICLSYHVNGVAIIYADPKGSSNPDVEDMAAYAGCGREEAMGALRVAYAILQHRIAQSARLKMKNFTATSSMPFIATVLDEFAQLLGDKSPHREEAAMIVAALAEQGRSLGMALVLCGQILNLDKMGSDTSIRDNVFYGGALVLLRSDSAQRNRVDLPDSFDGCDPSRIPAYWKGEDENLIYDPTIPEDDPSRTFGVGYVVGPDERAEMMRAWILESAAGLFDPSQAAVPADFPDWHNRDLIAVTPIGEAPGPGPAPAAWVPGQAPAMTKEPTAREKIAMVLDERRDPIGLEVGYLHLDQIIHMTGVTRKTTENTLSAMVKEGRLVRNPDAAGEYGLPLTNHPAPEEDPAP
jgi:hypothetical protein